MLLLLSLRVELLMFLKLQITIICIKEYMLFVNYVLDLNNGFRAKLVVEESTDIYLEYLEYMDYKSNNEMQKAQNSKLQMSNQR